MVKTKITMFLAETVGFTSQFVIPSISFLMKSDGTFPSRYVSTKSIPATIRELMQECCNLKYEIVEDSMEIVDLIHEEGSDEVEAVYSCLVTSGILVPRDNYAVKPISEMFIEEKYVKSIQSTPRL